MAYRVNFETVLDGAKLLHSQRIGSVNMSEGNKRDAEKAFGKRSSDDPGDSARKKNRKRRRHDRQSHGDGNQIPNGNVRGAVDGAARGNRDEIATISHGTQFGSRESGNIETGAAEYSDPRLETDTNNPDGKTKSRSKRGTKPMFDQETSHIELVLARAKENFTREPNAPAIEKPRPIPQPEIRPQKSKRLSVKVEPDEKKEKSGQKERKDKSHRQKRKHERPLERKWSISQPSRGAFIDHDPVLTSDEQHLLVAIKHAIHVYATKTSLLVRSMRLEEGSEIVTYAQLPDRDHYVAVGLKDGSLLKFDWTSGKKIWASTFSGSIKSILPTSSNETGDGFLMINTVDDGTCNMSSLAMDDKGRQVGRRTLLQQRGLLSTIRSCPKSGITIVCSKDTIFVGRLAEVEIGEQAGLEWHEIKIAGKIASFDSQILPARQGQAKASTQPIVNVAVGLRSGEIQVFPDVLSDSATQTKELSNRQLHWHRSAPRTVKYSPDSNYLISGGDETVLVIWQLETNQKQTLPHMATAILNATISQKGSAYALRLGDNSLMVLSTSDLQPFASISGLALDASSKLPYLAGHSPPAVLHPGHPSRLLLAYSLQSFNPAVKPADKNANMLQTYDVGSQIQISRQALARSLVAKVSTGPQGNSLHEPDVTHLDVSHDGKWLVTVDQWAPVENDLQEMYLTRGDNVARDQLNECFLRFWSTSSGDETGNGLWELNTRIDEPTSSTQHNEGKQILSLAMSPARHMVATADSTRTAKIYSPKARTRSGVPVRDADGNQLYTWTCTFEIPLHEASAISSPKSATMAFSEDGSVLAISWASTVSAKPRVHLIDTKSGKVAASLPDIVTGSKSHLAFCGQYLVALSSKLLIYDTVTLQQVWAIDVADKFDQGKSKLAVNTRSKIVAVALSQRDTKQSSQLLLFDVQAGSKKVKMDAQVPSQVQMLLAERDQAGFVVIDGEGRSMSVTPPGSVQTGLVRVDTVPEKTVVENGLANVFGNGRKTATASTVADATSVQQRTLEGVLQYERTAFAPEVKDLFTRVARVVAGAAA